MKNWQIRPEKITDIETIHQINLAAFGRESEANLVDLLRPVVNPLLSFVAEANQELVGHIFFSPVLLESDYGENCSCQILGLAPIAVLPSYQRQGVGSRLIEYSIQKCTDLGFDAIVVLGHPEYYPRFGFVPAKQKNLCCEYPVPDEVFLVLELKKDALVGCHGMIKYRSEFALV